MTDGVREPEGLIDVGQGNSHPCCLKCYFLGVPCAGFGVCGCACHRAEAGHSPQPDKPTIRARQLKAENQEIRRLRSPSPQPQTDEWRKSVSTAIKNIPEFHSGEWAGDKEGWGFHFEVVNWLQRHRTELEKRVGELEEALHKRDQALKIIRMALGLPETHPDGTDILPRIQSLLADQPKKEQP